MKNTFGDNSMAYFVHSSLRDEFYFVIIIQAINCLPILVCPYRAKILSNHIPRVVTLGYSMSDFQALSQIITFTVWKYFR